MTLMVAGKAPDGSEVPIKVAADGTVATSGGGGGGGGSSDTTEATQLLVKAAVEAINAATGTVTASPTANTILARLKDLLTGIVLAAGTNIIGKFGIDQTTPGTTDAITVKATGAFANITTATLSNVSGSATSVSLLASNANRKRIIIHNDSTAKLFVKFGTTASTTSFTLPLQPYETYESPNAVIYTGAIDGIWSSATGAARITEMV